MPVNMSELTELKSVAGVRLNSICAGIKRSDRDDVTLFEFIEGTTCAAVFTKNAFCAAPVEIAKQHLTEIMPRFWLINAGNANAGTGENGIIDATRSCYSVSTLGKCEQNQVLPFSTGVIGQPLPVEKIERVLPDLLNDLHKENWLKAARAIMTTDTVPKGISVEIKIGEKKVTITGISKGAGMIRPDMATMLAFIATDAKIESNLLQSCLNQAVEKSFNRITIDGDTSTNDACVLAATGKSIEFDQENIATFQSALNQVCIHLAQSIVRDGEGATKFITVEVLQGKTEQECLDVAYTIGHSPLVKTAFFASDANWGRILACVGRAGVSNLDLNAVEIYLGDVCIVKNGGRAPDYTEEQGQKVMSEPEILVQICLHRGNAQTQIWTCDFSYDYVKINAEYRT
jgi:glutamate N-acetyltransferase / amino-acid N-acetyltransferase